MEDDDLLSGSPPDSEEDLQSSENEDYEDEAAPEEETPPKKIAGVEVPAFAMYNGAFYPIPWSSGESAPGRVRDHNHVIYVESAEVLGQLQSSAKAWPKAKDIDPLAIVVSRGLFGPDQAISSEGPFWWSCRVGIQGKPNGDDTSVIRHIPKSKYLEILNYYAKLPHMQTSSLIKTYQAYADNAKPISMLASGFKADKSCALKSEQIKPLRKKKEEDIAEVSEPETGGKRKEERDVDAEPSKKKAVPDKKPVEKTAVEKKIEKAAPPKKIQSLFPANKKVAESQEPVATPPGVDCSTAATVVNAIPSFAFQIEKGRAECTVTFKLTTAAPDTLRFVASLS